MLKFSLFCGLLPLLATFSIAHGSKTPPGANQSPELVDTTGLTIAFDMHTHAMGLETAEGVQNYSLLLQDRLFEKAALISPSYLAQPGLLRRDGSEISVSEILVRKRAQDQAASLLVQTYPDRLIGLCGISLDWLERENTNSTLECLDLAGMTGLKVRFVSGVYLSEPQYRDHLEALLNAGRDKIRFVLLHLVTYEHARRNPDHSGYSEWVRLDEREIETAVRFMKNYPEIQFVLAHNLFGPRMVHYFAEKVREQEVANYWLDTSHVLPATLHADPELSEEEFHDRYAQAWRDLGVERVLFGSDVIAGVRGVEDPYALYVNSQSYIEEKLAIFLNPSLSDREKEKILLTNGIAFWNLIRRN